MARAESTDLLHNFRFQVTSVGVTGTNFLATEAPMGERYPMVGFATCQLPSYSMEASKYREGISTYEKKFPAFPTTEPIELTRGVAKADTVFFKWVFACIKGGEYRADVTIGQFHRDNKGVPARRYILNNAFPTNVKAGSDLDANNTEIAIHNMTLEYETFDIEVVGGEKVLS